VEDSVEELDVPAKILASSSSEDKCPTKDSHHSNQPYKQKYSEELIKVGFTCILINDEPRS